MKMYRCHLCGEKGRTSFACYLVKVEFTLKFKLVILSDGERMMEWQETSESYKLKSSLAMDDDCGISWEIMTTMAKQFLF